MDAKECADILRATIRHHERMHGEGVVFIGPDGAEEKVMVNPDNDILYHAMRFALSCVEKYIPK